MKKILIESCMKCPRYLSALYPSCQRIVTDVHAINPGCPLEDEPEQKPDLPESKGSETDMGTKIEPEFPSWTETESGVTEKSNPQYGIYHFLKHWYYRVVAPCLKSDGWIPVSERLPEPERNFIHPSNWFIRVLVCHTFGWREYFIEDHVKENLHQFMLEDAKSRLNGFTHWSIPALPAPQGEKEKEARTCKNCAQREGEECGINGREVYDDSTCNDWCEKD